MQNKLNVMGVTHCSAVDGPGLRTVVWFQGCRNKCPGCHNPESWDINTEMMLCTAEQLYELAAPNKLEDGLTLSGGDPLWQKNLFELKKFLKLYREKNPTKSVWVYTGLTFEELNDYQSYWCKKTAFPFLDIAPYIDVLVDGRYKEAERGFAQLYRGSGNQRLIDMQEVVRLCNENPNTSPRDYLRLYDSSRITV